METKFTVTLTARQIEATVRALELYAETDGEEDEFVVVAEAVRLLTKARGE